MIASSVAATCRQENGEIVNVVYALKQNAKLVKTALEEAGVLDKNFKMVTSETNPAVIALPVVKAVDRQFRFTILIIGQGSQLCPYSTKVMGRHRFVESSDAQAYSHQITLVQKAVLSTMDHISSSFDRQRQTLLVDTILDRLRDLGRHVVPEKLEIFGDDRTLIIPPDAFDGANFASVLHSGAAEGFTGNPDRMNQAMAEFWKQLAAVHGSPRIARRGTIDPNSRFRQSGHTLVFPSHGIPASTGPDSPGWISVTEQGIRQSFDMTRVMFSRGNISEKIRFGKLVNRDEIVLDLYAGIGYYTLPALIHGKARHVVACEWNSFALQALRYNVKDNGVAERVTVLNGDCRKTAEQHGLIQMFDRVSLGLLPSSEGGWIASVRALKLESGGRLHIHGNVPKKEKDIWACWVCHRLLFICREEKRPVDWIVLCENVEEVKSFAPTISHFVADVFVGPGNLHLRSSELGASRSGVLTGESCRVCVDPLPVPSCALSPDGPLSQGWMM